MKNLIFACVTTLLLAGMIQPAFALDDADAFSGLTSIRAIYDVRAKDEKTLQFIFKVIRDTYDETLTQGIKARYVTSMRGPTVKLLVRSRAEDQELQKETLKLINELTSRGVRLEACGYALKLFGVEPGDLYDGVFAVVTV